MARRKQNIGLQNRLEIVIQSLLDYQEEGGAVDFGIEEGQLVIELTAVVAEADGRFLVSPHPTLENGN